MTLRRLAIAAGLGVSLHAGPVVSEPQRKTLRLLPLGDSLTAGVGDKTDFGGYRGPLYRALEADGFDVRMAGSQVIGGFEQPACEGHPGWVIEQIHVGVDGGWIEAARPDAILLMIGTNDLFFRPEGAVARLTALVDDILTRVPRVRLFVATIPPAGEKHIAPKVAPYNHGLETLVAARRAEGKLVTLVDVHSSVLVTQMRDRVHPNAKAYLRIAERWYRALREVFTP